MNHDQQLAAEPAWGATDRLSLPNRSSLPKQVTLEDEDDAERVYLILEPDEFDSKQDWISVVSLVAMTPLI